MNKHLKIEVNGQEWVNGDFAEITFTDGQSGIRIEAKAARTAGAVGNSGGGLLEMLANASRRSTQAVAEEKRTSLQAPVEPDVVEAEPVD